MRIFVAGASGAVGRRLVPMLVERGHEVAGTTRTPTKAEQVRGLGARPVVIDALDRDRVLASVGEFKPDVIVHQLTAITGPPNLRKIDAYFGETNRLRTAGTDHLIAAARASGVRRMVAQSFAGWPFERTGCPVKTETDPLDPHPAANARETHAAIRYLEHAMMSATPTEGVVLRYGVLYGPGNSIGAGGEMLEIVRKRRFPVVGGGTGIWSFVHVDDAAYAAVVAAEGGPQGIYNIVDDEPAAVHEWLPYLAKVIGAKPPLGLPAWLLRPMLGEHATSMMTSVRGASNAKAHAELGWQPRHRCWRQGFRDGLG